MLVSGLFKQQTFPWIKGTCAKNLRDNLLFEHHVQSHKFQVPVIDYLQELKHIDVPSPGSATMRSAKLLRNSACNACSCRRHKAKRSKSAIRFRVAHQHLRAHETGQKIYDIDVLLAEDDGAAAVCWRLQIAEGEDMLDRLLAYAHTFGEHGSGDKDYDEYVDTF